MQASSGPVPALSISVVVHNSPLPALRETLSSLQCAVAEAERGAVVQNVSLTLVDNASAPDYRVRLGLELKALQAQWADAALPLKYQPLDTNRGFGAGHNVALRAAEAEFYLILNPDVVLQRDSLLLGLRRLADSRDIALLSPLTTGPDGRREYLCKAYPSVWVLLLRGFVPDAPRRRLAPHSSRVSRKIRKSRKACSLRLFYSRRNTGLNRKSLTKPVKVLLTPSDTGTYLYLSQCYASLDIEHKKRY